MSEDVNHVLLLNLSDLLLAVRVGEGLRDRVVLDLLSLDVRVGDLAVGLCHALEVLLLLSVSVHIALPLIVAVVHF